MNEGLHRQYSLMHFHHADCHSTGLTSQELHDTRR